METQHDVIQAGQLSIRFLLEGSQTAGALAMFEFGVPAGAKVPVAHSHDAYEETVYGLEGVLTFTVEGKATEIRPGDVLSVARGTVHRFDNFHPEDAKALAVITPALLGPDYFREIAAILSASAGGPPDFAAIGAAMKRHGLTPAP